MVGCADLMLDLSEVREVDADAVRLLAHLAPELYGRLACPKWLAVRMEIERRHWTSAEAIERVA